MVDLKVRACNSRKGCPALEHYLRSHRRLVDFCRLTEELYDLRRGSLGLPSVMKDVWAGVRALKKFCSGLLEGEPHQWRAVVSRLPRRSRQSISASLFLFRKVLPSPEVDLAAYVDKMSTPSPSPDPDFLAFCSKKLERMFKDGWDRHYTRLCEEVVPTSMSCTERSRSDGGSRNLIASGDSWLCAETYSEVCRGARAGSLRLGPSRVTSVESGGKKRIVSVPSVDMNLLRPLHVALYDHLSRMPWLLRGDATPNRFKDFVRTKGEVFVSGDYESATDNLNTGVQKFILREVLRNASSVPDGIKELAESSLSMGLAVRGGEVVMQKRGQMMGNLLSFPLLCLVNFLAFKYFVRRKVPLAVNGDDIVFRATPSESERWVSGVGQAGLTLSKGKTMIDGRFFSLNSTFFEGSDQRVRLVPVIRAKALFGCVEEGVMSLHGRFRSFAKGFSRLRREILVRSFLRLNHRFILASGRSVRNGLRLPVSDEQLRDVGLLERESRYLETTGEWMRECPLGDLAKSRNPYRVVGWVLRREIPGEDVRSLSKQHASLIRREMWTVPVGGKDVSIEVKKEWIRETGHSSSVRGWKECVKRFAALLRTGRREVNRWLCRRRVFPPVRSKAFGDLEWLPDVGRTGPIVFLSSGFEGGTL